MQTESNGSERRLSSDKTYTNEKRLPNNLPVIRILPTGAHIY